MDSLPVNELSLNNFQESFISNVTIDKSSTESSSSCPTYVNLRFTIALAVPAESPLSNDPVTPPVINYGSRRVSETSKVQGYYRIEYSLIPGETNMGFDLTVFRTAAKIYPDNQDGRIVLTWEDENENVWIVWDHVHKLELNRERLLALLSHKILVKIWDGREYCTVRTRLDKPRIGRALPGLLACVDDENSPKNVVQSLAQNYADKWISRPLLYKLRRRLPINLPIPSSSLQKKIDQTDNRRTPTPSVLQERSLVNSTGENSTIIEDIPIDAEGGSHPGILKRTPDENLQRKKGTRNNKQVDEKKEKGAAQIIVPSNLLFAGIKMITCRHDENVSLPRTIQDCFVGIHIEDYQLINDFIGKEFNPLSITITSVENMPSTPISYGELKQRCEPVYCSYQLFDEPVHQTSKKSHARHISWNDFNLYLTNLIDDNSMSQFRNSPIVNIELHDRDERVTARRRIGSVFGTENADDAIGRVSGKINLLKSKPESNWHPHGCVKLDLSELWLGQTSLEFSIPVVPCHAPELASGRSKRTSLHENTSIQQGDFLSNGTQMNILVKLAKPFSSSIENRELISPFTRIVFVFPYDNTKFLTALETSIRRINAKALDFDKHPAHVQVAALSTYKLTEAQQTSQTLNIITGFHLFDDEQHVFVLEGRKEDAIDILYKELPKPEGKNVEILYDSTLHFTERLYVKLGLDLTHIKLCRTLRDIISQPLIFVRDIIPKGTFDAVEKLHQLVTTHKLSSSARYNLFPTIEMIISLSRDFGVPLTEKEIKLFSTDDRSPSASTTHDKQNQKVEPPPQNSVNQSRQERIKTPEGTTRSDTNFLQRNIQQTQLVSLRNKETRKKEDNLVFMTTGPIYPYSTQKLNSTENALEQMRTYLKQNHSSSSCSFNPEYRSGTFSPYSNEETVLDYHRALRSPLDIKDKDKYNEKTSSDWVTYPGYRSSRQSNIHPRSPDRARLDELSKPPEEWYDHTTHNRHSPALTREPFKWTNRKDDFDRWTRLSPSSQQISAHWQSLKDTNKTSSTSAVVVTDERMHFLRRSPTTEMTTGGRLSSTQLDRLTGILKDKPLKKGLLLPKAYSRTNGAQSAPLSRKRSLTSTPDRRIRSTTTFKFRTDSPV